MSATKNRLSYETAVQDFRRARQQAALQQLMARITGKSADLLSYDAVEEGLQVLGTEERGVQEIPLDQIVGSVGRYKDFTRDFLPKRDSDEERWARVKAAVIDMSGLPPIEVYQVGDVYFVKDGNHRVSVARQLGSETITAYVTEVKTRVPLTAVDDVNELICKARYAEFLAQTNLDKIRPDADLMLTFCNQFRWFLDQIEAHKRQMEDDVTYEAAVADWYDQVYMPVITLMREQGIMRNFPRRREADIYYLVMEHREELEDSLGWELSPATAASDLVGREEEKARGVLARLSRRLREVFIPEELAEGPAPGAWRQQQLATGRQSRLFADYLVAISGTEADWEMLAMVIKLAQWEDDRLLGLHVVATEEEKDAPRTLAVRDQFLNRCEAEDVAGEFAIETGNVVDVILQRAAWADLVVTSLTHPPGPQPLERLSSGFSQLVQRCPRPLLVVPTGSNSLMERVLLCYDGSPKADEALFVATYLKIRWPISLVVVTVETEFTPPEALDRARAYIEQYGIDDVEYVLRQKPIATAVLDVADEYDRNYMIMGGFGFRPVMHLMLGSTVDEVLRKFRNPVLICR